MRGLTLVELLVSMAIGLILMLAVIAAYLGSAGASASTQAQARMNEDAQAALSIIAQHVRMAGNNPKQLLYATGTSRNPVFGTTTWAIRGCDGLFTNVTTAASNGALICGAGGSASLAVAYEADRYNTVATAGNLPTDCLGQVLPTVTGTANVWNTPTANFPPTAVTFAVADTRFYIGSSGAGTAPSLYCKGNGAATPQPLVENVEDMEITYGVAPTTSGTTLTVAGYLSAGEILTAPTLAALPDDQTRWSFVGAVRICITVRSDQALAPSAESAHYFKCDGTLETAPPDLRLRRVYSTTVVLRNRIAS
jgi:type IV pilus assembly protein PilW